MLRVDRYSADDAAAWNDFVARSRNGTFLFDRGYMDYHADRFRDHSLIFRDKDGVVALLPAHEVEGRLASHGGLTYGGFIVDEAMTLVGMRECFESLIEHMKSAALSRLTYKTIPHIYHRAPCEEDIHALFALDAVLYRRDVLLVIDNAERGPVQERRKRAFKKARRGGLTVRQSDDYAAYWPVLTENLRSKYGCDPVHSLEEMQLLAGRFPQNISLMACFDGDEIVAGVVVYASDRVAHLQYIGSSDAGRDRGALDLLMEELIERWREKRYFDFGCSTENDGRYVNAGLAEFKQGFGARTIVHDFYTLDIR